MAAGIDDAGQPIPNEQRIMVPKFKFRPVDESTVMDLLRNLDIRTATGVVSRSTNTSWHISVRQT